MPHRSIIAATLVLLFCLSVKADPADDFAALLRDASSEHVLGRVRLVALEAAA